MQFAHGAFHMNLRIIMVTSGLDPPKATVKALTVMKKNVPGGAPSKFRTRFVDRVFNEVEIAPVMETM